MTEMVYTVDEAAEILRCGPNYVRKLIKSGKLKCMKLGHIKIRKSTLEEFLESYEGYDMTNPSDPVLLNMTDICNIQ